MRPLFRDCQKCRTAASHKTRQRAFGARPAGDWHTVCPDHLPGSLMHKLPPALQHQAGQLNAHEIVALPHGS